MTFKTDLAQFTIRVEDRARAVFFAVTDEVKRSVVEGSPITGAPGQPVDTGYLKASWQESFDGPDAVVLSTNTEYAEIIEDGIYIPPSSGRDADRIGIRPLNLRSAVGGFHSVKLTLAAAQSIVDHATAEVAHGR